MTKALQRVEQIIEGCLRNYCASVPGLTAERFQPISRANRPTGKPFDDEAEALVAGLQAGIVAIDPVGRFEFPNVRYGPRWPLGLFFRGSASHPDPTIHLWWE